MSLQTQFSNMNSTWEIWLANSKSTISMRPSLTCLRSWPIQDSRSMKMTHFWMIMKVRTTCIRRSKQDSATLPVSWMTSTFSRTNARVPMQRSPKTDTHVSISLKKRAKVSAHPLAAITAWTNKSPYQICSHISWPTSTNALMTTISTQFLSNTTRRFKTAS